MKRKLITILAIAAVLLFAAGAYILMFHSQVSVEYYLAKGDAAMENEKYSKAVGYFRSALELAEDDPQISIQLANAYKYSGNYTKAEYTLVRAITADPSRTALYVALSRIYVEQEKFLDADLLLSRASNADVKAELEAMRPAAPVLTPDAGYYSDYITVSASCVAGRIFLSTDGVYPSNESHLYKNPVALEQGETIIYALVVDDSGLTSPIREAAYTVAGVVEPITLSDSGLNTLVRKLLGKGNDDVIMTNELWGIEKMTLTADVKELRQLSHFIGLKELKMNSAAVSDLSVLTTLPLLQKLDLSGCILSAANLRTIGELTRLNELNLSTCAVTNIDALANLKKLTVLNLSNNVITDVMALTQMTALTDLDLSNNPITALQSLQYCANLDKLNLSGCEIESLEALAGLVNLKGLNLSNNSISSLEPLQNCISLENLDVSYNNLKNIAAVEKLTALQEFSASHNQIATLPKMPAKLIRVDLSYNKLTKIDGLQNRSMLNHVNIDYNKVADILPLKNCYNLVQLDAWNNPITSGVTTLTNQSVIVNWNPNYKG